MKAPPLIKALKKLTLEEAEQFPGLALASELDMTQKETAFKKMLLGYFFDTLPRDLVFEQVLASDLDSGLIDYRAKLWAAEDSQGMLKWIRPLLEAGGLEGRGLGVHPITHGKIDLESDWMVDGGRAPSGRIRPLAQVRICTLPDSLVVDGLGRYC